jgi:hypothetical protein
MRGEPIPDGKPMNILHVITSYFPKVRYGRPIYAIRSLARALVQEGHRVVVYTTNVNVDQRTKIPLADPIRRKGMGEIGRAVARDKFCWSTGANDGLSALHRRNGIL